MWQSLKFCLAKVKNFFRKTTTKESSWLFVEWFVVKKNGMIFSKDVRQLLLVHSSSSVRIYHFFDRFIYSDPPDCLDSAVHSVSKSQNGVCEGIRSTVFFSEDPLFCDYNA